MSKRKEAFREYMKREKAIQSNAGYNKLDRRNEVKTAETHTPIVVYLMQRAARAVRAFI